MKDTISEIQEWISQQGYRKWIAFVIIFFSINTVIWGIVEPMNLSCDNYSYYHYAAVLLLSILVFYRFIKYRVLKTIDFESSAEWQTIHGNPVLTVEDDKHSGKILRFQGTHADVSDFTIKGVGYMGSRFTIEYIPAGEDFFFYTKIRIVSSDKRQFRSVHLYFSFEHEIPIETFPGDEWTYPLKSVIVADHLFKSQIDLTKAIKQTFGRDGWSYRGLIGLRVRGAGEIHSIYIR